MSPLQNLALTLFENDVYTMVRNIEFKNVRNNASEIRSSKNLCFLEQASKPLQFVGTDYNGLLDKNFSSNYRKCKNGIQHKISRQAN